MRILLINPPFQRLNKVCNPYFPLGLGYIAAALDGEGYFVRIYNADKGEEEQGFPRAYYNEARISAHDNFIQAIKDPGHYVWREIEKTLKEFNPDVIGIQAMSSTFPSTQVVAKLSKDYNRTCPVIVGGIHPTIQPHQVISDPNIDFAVYGEGEITMLELVTSLKKKMISFNDIDGIYYKNSKGEVVHSQKREFIPDLDKVAFPARNLVLNPELYSPMEFGSIIMTRGCPFECTFCNANSLWTRKIRSRSSDNIVSEIKLLKEQYNVTTINFQDDTLTCNLKRLKDLCNLLIDSKLKVSWTSYSRVEVISQEILSLMKKSGCVRLSFGVESGSEKLLKLMKKKIKLAQVLRARELLKNNAIEFNTSILIGTPDESKEDLIQTINFLKKLNPDSVNVCTYTPYPGSQMFNRAVELGLVTSDQDWLYISHHSKHTNFTKNISDNDFNKLRSELVSIADILNNKIDLQYLKSKLKLFISDPSYFTKRIPYYIKNFPRHLKYISNLNK